MTPHLGDVVSALADGQLAPADEEVARRHLAGCPSCSAELVATLEVRALVRRLPAVHPRRPLIAVDASPRRPSRAAGLLAAAAASVALLMLSGMDHDNGSVPQVAQLVQVHSTAPVNVDPMSQLAPALIPASLER